MLTLSAPAPDSLDGDRLRDQLAEAGITSAEFYLSGDRLTFPALDDSDRTLVESALSAHMNRPAPSDPEAEFRAALTAATTVTQLRDALLGKAGPGAQARRPDNR